MPEMEGEKMKRQLILIAIICFIIHFKNGENIKADYREVIAFGGDFGAAKMVAFYNNDKDKLVVSPESYWYYETCEEKK